MNNKLNYIINKSKFSIIFNNNPSIYIKINKDHRSIGKLYYNIVDCFDEYIIEIHVPDKDLNSKKIILDLTDIINFILNSIGIYYYTDYGILFETNYYYFRITNTEFLLQLI